MKSVSRSWLLLISNLPGKNQASRMRIWRALKAYGAALIRDGVYVLPKTADSRKLFAEQLLEIQASGGTAHVLTVGIDSHEQQETLMRLFDRTSDYQGLQRRINDCRRGLGRIGEAVARKLIAGIERDLNATSAMDFFPDKAQKQVRSALADALVAANWHFSPGEPQPNHRRIPRRDRKQFLGRIWATRRHMWIDRVSSAWLIRRFIDPQAKFVWLIHIKNKPKRAIGFDFDGAEFSHVGSKVTFEVLLRSFGLESDAALARLGALVHFLDVGGIPVEEAPGFAAIVSGARALAPDDEVLLRSVTPALDGLYHSFRAN